MIARAVWWAAAASIAFPSGGAIGKTAGLDQTSTDEFVRPARIPIATISSRGSWAAYLILRDDVGRDKVCVSVRVASVGRTAEPITLDEFCANANVIFDGNDNFRRGPGNVRWLDNENLAFVAPDGEQQALFVWNAKTRKRSIIRRAHAISFDGDAEPIVMIGVSSSPQLAARGRVISSNTSLFGVPAPSEDGLLQTYWRIGSNFSLAPVERAQEDSDDALPRASSNSVTYIGQGLQSLDGAAIAHVEDANLKLDDPMESYQASRLLISLGGKEQEIVSFERPRHWLMMLGWAEQPRRLYYVALESSKSSVWVANPNGRKRNIASVPGGLVAPGAPYGRNPLAVSRDGQQALLVRSSSLMPDELVAIALKDGRMTSLDRPNADFDYSKTGGVLHYELPPPYGDVYGNLYLPRGYDNKRRYPLVIVHYVARPGYYAGTGEEIPILSLTSRGIAVFAMHSRELNTISLSGDFRLELARLSRPLSAMKWIIDRLYDEGRIDRTRVGVAGLSYGTEIASYALFASNLFCAVSIGGGPWHPQSYALGGQSYVTNWLSRRGFPDPEQSGATSWKEISLGLNTRKDLAPLLIQSADSEENLVIPNWLALQRQGAPVEWIEYRDEGHIKSSPLDKWWIFSRNVDWFLFWLAGHRDSEPAKAEQYERWQKLSTPDRCR